MEETMQTPPPSKRRGSGWLLGVKIAVYTVLWLILFGILTGLVAAGAVGGYVAALVKDDPVRPRSLIEEKINENAITGFVYFNDNTLVGQLRTEEDRQPVTYDEIPQIVIDAVLSIEDKDFFNHIGIDSNGLMRAVKQQVLNESVQTGGSTITQQLARQVFLTLDRTNTRKAKEIFLSLRLERFLNKEEILTAYLNKIAYGNGSSGYNLYGIKAAARGIFGVELKDLNLAQAAYLAGVPQLPSAHSAFTSKGEFNESRFNRAVNRQKLVLAKMLEYGKITQAEYEEALAFDLYASLAKPVQKAYNTYPYLMLEVERQAAQLLVLKEYPELTKEDLSKEENAPLLEQAREQLLRGGYKVKTTIDKEVYDLMHDIAENPDNFSPDDATKGVEQIASIMIDHKTGAILGMIEGREFHIEQLNFATQMLRQPGSAMKPIAAYLPAIDKGLIQPASVLDDAPIILNNGSGGAKHIPKNSNNTYTGLVTARTALDKSLNTAALKIFLEKLTIPEAWDFARKLGITSLVEEDNYAQTGVIGGLKYGVSVEELTNAYAAIANKGVFNDAYMIEEITDAEGNVVYKHTPNPQRVVSEQSAYLMTDMMRTVITSGTATSIKSQFENYGKIPVVGKTGTTQNYADVWFEGYTPDITLGVWAGYEKSTHTLSTKGRARAREIWAKIMNEVTEAKPELFPTDKFEKPDGIVSMTVSSVSGKLPTDLTRQAGRLTTDIFNKKFIPTESDDALVKVQYITYNGVNYLPHDETPSDLLREAIMVKREKPIDELIGELQAALPNVSSESRKSLSYYLPKDAKDSAPSKTDPRSDDGGTPSAPSNVSAETLDGGKVRITFTPSPQKDVAGYRLYRSVNGGPFQKVENSVFTGDEAKFINYISSSNAYQYYVTAVDVVGKESGRSAVVSAGSGAGEIPVDPNLPPAGGTDGGSGGTSDPGSTQAPGTEAPGSEAPGTGNPLAAPGSPSGLQAQIRDTGLALSWNPNSDADAVTKYEVWYSPSQNGKYTLLGSAQTPGYEAPAPVNAGWYRITAINGVGQSEPSAAIEVKTN
ncbi:penicillin-binding protein 1A [Cohnella algarum]|uniref:penicillin-binding protein 1A n=1 Tax=Cohnella algarum TaxID=2044859 RepID=UPI001967A64D|nr:penicillin-binding protein 1A [Cohnella algarum]MBN2983453.1 transglycosylase domain-containing protein [Cohnella algarum]